MADNDDLQDDIQKVEIDVNFPGREIFHELQNNGLNFDQIMKNKFGEAGV